MGADSIVSIVLYSVAAGAALLSTCASPKEDEKAAVVNTQAVAEEKVQAQQTTTAQAASQGGFVPVDQQQQQQNDGKSGVKVLVHTGPQVDNQKTSTASQEQPVKQEQPIKKEPPKEQPHEVFMKAYLKSYYTGDSAYVLSKNTADDQGLKELIALDVVSAKAEADAHGGFQEVVIKNVTKSEKAEEFEFYVNVKFKDGSIAEQHKFMATQIDNVWKAY